MFIEIPPCSSDHIRRVVFRGSLPMPGSEVHYRCQVPRFCGITSRVFQKCVTVVGT